MVADVYLLGKALGGGIVPVSAVVADADVLGVFQPGEHGSTFGGNPLACAVGAEVVSMLATGSYQARAAALSAHLRARLNAMRGQGVVGVRVRGLWAGVDVRPGPGHRPGSLRSAGPPPCAGQGHPRLHPSGWPRRW